MLFDFVVVGMFIYVCWLFVGVLWYLILLSFVCGFVDGVVGCLFWVVYLRLACVLFGPLLIVFCGLRVVVCCDWWLLDCFTFVVVLVATIF